MLGRQAKLPRNVVLRQFADELVGMLVQKHVVEAQAAAHEHLLHPGKGAQLAQHIQVVAVVHLKASAGLRRQAALAAAGALVQLLGTGGLAEVRGGAAHVVDVALEIGVFGKHLRLFHQAFLAAALDDAALMERQRAERALADAPAVAG